jgi:hypothetical protein
MMGAYAEAKTVANVEVVAAERVEEKPKSNHQLAWDQVTDDKSWLVASEKSDISTEKFGISCWEDLCFLNEKEIEELMGKLKTVPARKFETFMKAST